MTIKSVPDVLLIDCQDVTKLGKQAIILKGGIYDVTKPVCRE